MRAFTWSPADPLVGWPCNCFPPESGHVSKWFEALLLVRLCVWKPCNCRARLTQWCDLQVNMYTMIQHSDCICMSYVNVVRKMFIPQACGCLRLDYAKLNAASTPDEGTSKCSMQCVCTSLQQCGSWIGVVIHGLMCSLSWKRQTVTVRHFSCKKAHLNSPALSHNMMLS